MRSTVERRLANVVVAGMLFFIFIVQHLWAEMSADKQWARSLSRFVVYQFGTKVILPTQMQAAPVPEFSPPSFPEYYPPNKAEDKDTPRAIEPRAPSTEMRLIGFSEDVFYSLFAYASHLMFIGLLGWICFDSERKKVVWILATATPLVGLSLFDWYGQSRDGEIATNIAAFLVVVPSALIAGIVASQQFLRVLRRTFDRV